MNINLEALKQTEAQSWHTLDGAAAAAALAVDPAQGLASSDARERRLAFGANAIQTIRPRPAWRMLVDQFTSLVIGLLAVAAAVAWATGDHLEGIAILVVLIINAIVGFATEWQAGRALDALRRQAQTITRLRRDGVEKNVDAEELVPGDIVVLNAGDRVPADARLIEAARLQVEESALTGESATVEKAVEPVAAQTSLTERRSMLYLGTGIASGHALALVVATGLQTELGRIGHPHAYVAISFSKTNKIRQRFHVGLGVAARVDHILPLVDHTEIPVIQVQHQYRQFILQRGRQLLNVHLNTAVPRHADDGFIRQRQLHAQRGRQTEAHGS